MTDDDSRNLFSDVEDIIYTNCYCEENVWHLCNAVKVKRHGELCRCYCVFISNKDRQIPLWLQKASSSEDGVVVWDYHVIFIHISHQGSFVYDLDSRLAFPTSFCDYFRCSIRPCAAFKPEFHRRFRLIEAELFLQTFASDRSHMLTENGEWKKPPPCYPCIRTNESENNIQDFISMENGVGVGKVLNSDELCEMFG
ncbi:protein N-terminal glutamine amidohydrolase-like [Dreissena polymorpha]|uniref:Protein N-terminal glutamine amidohydrolase n=1 Tax=Dreissena polymorpha TaxID=45954 RepID=A0A9D4N234_DREPO|nr:protein N-terminal glutamine amidohydrolase-like [Dreissena polymorpha]KAH3886433.1 hypothetical protein DPMN_010440 [Dreissena polymorpha]